MTVLAIATEELHVDKVDSGPAIMYTSTAAINGSATFNANLSRAAFRVLHAANGGPTCQVLFASSSEIWFHFSFHSGFHTVVANTYDLIQFRSGSAPQVRIATTNPSSLTTGAFVGQFQVSTNGGSSWTNVGPTFNMGGAYTVHDIHIKFHASAGAIDFYTNDALTFSYSGALVSQTNTVDNVYLTTDYTDFRSYKYYSQIVIADSSTVGMRLCTLYPNAAGAQTDWTGAYTDVDEISTVITDFVTSDTANALILYGLSDVPAAYNQWTPVAVFSSVYGTISPDATITTLNHALRTNSTNYTQASGFVHTGLRQTDTKQWTTNPNTGIAFTIADINALQLGTKVT